MVPCDALAAGGGGRAAAGRTRRGARLRPLRVRRGRGGRAPVVRRRRRWAAVATRAATQRGARRATRRRRPHRRPAGRLPSQLAARSGRARTVPVALCRRVARGRAARGARPPPPRPPPARRGGNQPPRRARAVHRPRCKRCTGRAAPAPRRSSCGCWSGGGTRWMRGPWPRRRRRRGAAPRHGRPSRPRPSAGRFGPHEPSLVHATWFGPLAARRPTLLTPLKYRCSCSASIAGPIITPRISRCAVL